MKELLAPAGDFLSARAALNAGADAVYLGLSRFSARASAANFSLGELKETARYAHLLGAKVYVALNTLVKTGETAAFFSDAAAAWNCGADAILIQDIFLGRALKRAYPEMVLHLSTQGGCCNVHGARIAKEFGFSRAVLARETPLSEIKKISSVIETEVFVQGALCTCFSGQCYFSSFAGNNSGNRGRCKQPCRKKYSLDRKGYEEPAYALSLSDLSAGERIRDLENAGVCSFKIEGRMRRPEYVAAAVKYYRALLVGGKGAEELSALKRAYNRGDYTRGLAFGQENLLSRKVQGHIGERVGFVSVRGGKYFCKSKYIASRGDGFKILRGGREVGGAAFAFSAEEGFALVSDRKLLEGDEVRLTTDTAGNAALLSFRRGRPVQIFVRVLKGEKPSAACGDFVCEGDEEAQPARTVPLSAEEISACFARTDGLPLLPEVTVRTEGAFLPKSALNAFRRKFYEGLCAALSPEREPLEEREFSAPILQISKKCEGAEIGEIPPREGIFICKPRDYSRLPEGKQRAYLYLPPLFTERDEALVSSRFSDFDGIYCEGYYGMALAKKYGLKLFAGTGFNLTNPFAVAGVKEYAERFVLSKELSAREQEELAAEGSFALAEGGVKVMDLCYCPFEKSCSSCDRRTLYTLTDEEGRAFPLRRYELNGCRFEVYNCAPLRAEAGASPLRETTPLGQENVPPTKGHSERSML